MRHEKHYDFRHEPIDVIEDWDLNFSLGSALKYIARCNHKGTKKQDLQKAINYLQREIKNETEKEAIEMIRKVHNKTKKEV